MLVLLWYYVHIGNLVVDDEKELGDLVVGAALPLGGDSRPRRRSSSAAEEVSSAGKCCAEKLVRYPSFDY